MPVVPLFAPTVLRTEQTALFLTPSHLPKVEQTWIATTIGTSNNGLQTTTEDMLRHFAEENLSAVAFVFGPQEGWAFACFQYYDWLDVGTTQLWITDVCRIGPKQPISPVVRLFALLEETAKQHGIHELWLMVDVDRLRSVYASYGFVEHSYREDLGCFFLKKNI